LAAHNKGGVQTENVQQTRPSDRNGGWLCNFAVLQGHSLIAAPIQEILGLSRADRSGGVREHWREAKVVLERIFSDYPRERGAQK
jgi:hypothetical protein